MKGQSPKSVGKMPPLPVARSKKGGSTEPLPAILKNRSSSVTYSDPSMRKRAANVKALAEWTSGKTQEKSSCASPNHTLVLSHDFAGQIRCAVCRGAQIHSGRRELAGARVPRRRRQTVLRPEGKRRAY